MWSLLTWQQTEAPAIRGALLYQVVARLRDHVTVDQAQADMENVTQGMARDLGRAYTGSTVYVELIHEYAVGRVRPALRLLGAVTGLLLLVACLNVASLLLAQAASRRREIAVQRALGATRARIVQRLLTEGVVLAALAGGAGTLAVWLLLPAVRALLPPTTPRVDEIGIDTATLGWSLVLILTTIVVAGMIPSWRGSSIDASAELSESSRGMTGGPIVRRWSDALTVAQLATVSVLLIGGGLLLHSFWKVQRVDLGFDSARVLTMEMRLLDVKYRDAQRARAFQDDLLGRVRALPGVTGAALTSSVPFRGVDYLFGGLRGHDGSTNVAANRRYVDPQYFEVMRTSIVAGRAFSESDSATSTQVAIVSESLARALFGDELAVGKLLPLRPSPLTPKVSPPEIVGVVADVRHLRIEDAGAPAFYVPRSQSPSTLICLVIRTGPNADHVAAAVRSIVQAIDPDQPVQGVTTLEEIVSGSVAERRFFAIASMLLSLVALILVSAGLFGVVAFGVGERVREFGVRAALGATPANLIALVVRQGARPVVVGLTLGVVAAFWATRLIRQFLFGVSAVDPLVYVCVAALVAVFGLLACYLPARQAARLDPMTALRHF